MFSTAQFLSKKDISRISTSASRIGTDGAFLKPLYGKFANPLSTAREWDSETGLYYSRARHYSPSLGRFIQRDPLGYYDSANLYAYVGNNPTNFTDPLGLMVKGGSPKPNNWLTFMGFASNKAEDEPTNAGNRRNKDITYRPLTPKERANVQKAIQLIELINPAKAALLQRLLDKNIINVNEQYEGTGTRGETHTWKLPFFSWVIVERLSLRPDLVEPEYWQGVSEQTTLRLAAALYHESIHASGVSSENAAYSAEIIMAWRLLEMHNQGFIINWFGLKFTKQQKEWFDTVIKKAILKNAYKKLLEYYNQ